MGDNEEMTAKAHTTHEYYLEHLSEIIPIELAHQWCLLFRGQVLDSFDTCGEAKSAKQVKWKNIYVTIARRCTCNDEAGCPLKETSEERNEGKLN